MREVNLLPPAMVSYQKHRKLVLRLIAAEAIIFLLFVLTVWSILLSVRIISNRSDSITAILQDETYREAEDAAEAVKDITAKLDTRQILLSVTQATLIDMAWLDTINDTLPDGVSIRSVTISETAATVTAMAHDLSMAEIHRSGLTSSGTFAGITLQSAARLNHETVQYTLSLGFR